jgi:hypothetical protein
MLKARCHSHLDLSISRQFVGAASCAAGLTRKRTLLLLLKTCSLAYAERSLNMSRQIIDPVLETNHNLFVVIEETAIVCSSIPLTGYAHCGSRLFCFHG